MPTQTSAKPHFSLLATSFAGGPRPRIAATILFGLWFLLFFAALFAPPILDDADATHASAARAMATTGDLVTLKVDGVRYLEKAPLPYWLAALSFRLFGFNTFAAHLPQAIAVLLLMLLGHRWANQAFGARTGFYTAVAILTSVGVFLFTRILIPEALLSLFLGASLFAFLKSVSPPGPWVPPVSILRHGTDAPETIREQPSIAWDAGPLFYPYVMWASLACAVLTKGLVALVFFFSTTFLFLLLTGTLRDWKKLRPATGLLLLFAIAAPWHILAGLRNTGGMDGHGFFWFYFINEHVLRFLGKRVPADYNKLPGYLYWTLNLVWLFPWTLFLPLGIGAIRRRSLHQNTVLTRHIPKDYSWGGAFLVVGFICALTLLGQLWRTDPVGEILVCLAVFMIAQIMARRVRAHLPPSPFHRIDPQQRTILLLALFAAIVLVFFSLSTNQEYYTFPAYLPILLLIAATITRAEQTYSSDPKARRWITFAHAAFTLLGGIVALILICFLWVSHNLPYEPDIALAHRGVGSYTLSMSSFFDLTGQSFAGLRLPAIIAALAFAFGPALAWMLRIQRRHLAATTCIAFTAGGFLFAAHIALTRFGTMLSSENLAAQIQQLEAHGRIAPDTQVMLFGDQAYGSSIPFYLDRRVYLVDGRSSSMLFGSTFPDAPPIFLTIPELQAQWGRGPRKILFIPIERLNDANAAIGPHRVVLEYEDNKQLITDRPLDGNP